jgi:DNA-binding LacI/PurR family transcriptional regulator
MNSASNRDQISETDRPLVGLLITDLGLAIERDFVHGVMKAAERQDVSIICFAGGSLRASSAANMAFELAETSRLDGVILSTPLGHLVTREELRKFCARYASVPMVTGAFGLGDYPEVVTDNAAGMQALVSHLIEEHGYSRIAFIGGPEHQPDAQIRYQAYADSLEAHGLDLDPDLTATGDFGRASGAACMQELWDRGLRIEAVVAASDIMAGGAYERLRELGVAIPEEVAVAGFDDMPFARHLPVPLTTVRQSFQDMGRRAVAALLSLIDGDEVPEVVLSPANLVVRRSCGCLPKALQDVPLDEPSKPDNVRDLSELAAPKGVSGDLWQALISSMKEDGRFMSFLPALERELLGEREGIDIWHHRLSLLRHHIVPAIGDVETLRRVEARLQQGRMLVAEAVMREEQRLSVEREARIALAQEFGVALGDVATYSDLIAPVEEFWPRLGIHEGFVVLHDAGNPSMQEAEVILAYQGGQAHVRRTAFSVDQVVPPEVLSSGERVAFVVFPLSRVDEYFGYALLTYTAELGRLLQVIAEELNSAIYRIQLLQRAQRAREEAVKTVEEMERTRLIADRVHSAPDSEAVLRIALEELSQVLGASTAVARLGTRDQLLTTRDEDEE